jgi:hypothetical protein
MGRKIVQVIMLTGGGRESGCNRWMYLYRVMNGKGDEADWKGYGCLFVRIQQNKVMYKRCGQFNSDAILHLILSQFPATTFSCLVDHDRQTDRQTDWLTDWQDRLTGPISSFLRPHRFSGNNLDTAENRCVLDRWSYSHAVWNYCDIDQTPPPALTSGCRRQ